MHDDIGLRAMCPRCTGAVYPRRAQAGVTRAHDIELRIVSDMKDFLRRKIQFCARHVEDPLVGLGDPAPARGDSEFEKVRQTDAFEIGVAVRDAYKRVA